jgi:hypothetical protein
MANTTNYNWETPDDTDLVKDGAAAIRTLGSSIDTTTKALNPETTLGDIAYRSSTSNTNTRLPIGSNGQILGVSAGVPAWINNDQGDITEVQAGTGISVASGTGPIPVVTNTVATAYDAKGDLIVGTGADTFSRLAVGTNGHTLVADSAQATGVKWAAPASGVTFAGVSCYNTPNNQSLSNNTYTVITWDSEDFDTDGYHSTSSNTSRITIPSGKGGKYLFNGGIYFDNAQATGFRELALYKNGTKFRAFFAATPGGGTTAYPAPQVNIVVEAVATDYFQLYARQNSGTNLTQYFDEGCWFQATYLGA